MKRKITIAIDGFSSTGKSTLAKQLAQRLGYLYVDSGAMYRAVTYFAMEHGYISREHFDKDSLINALPSVKLEFQLNEETGSADMYLNGTNVEDEIRTIAVSNLVSRVAEISKVRKMLVQQQQQMGKEKGVVMDGRDIGTVVFPDAELKIFMTASPQTRAQRRYEELQQKGQPVSYDEVLKNVEERDRIDTHREDSPLLKAADAIEIDNSELDRNQQFDIVLDLVMKICSN
ncbi:MAG TPA: (d)CMP kinase [Flavobacterium sp.]